MSSPTRSFKQERNTSVEVSMSDMLQDSILKSFSTAQKEYIIKHLYPEISKALIHFISEAKRHN